MGDTADAEVLAVRVENSGWHSARRLIQPTNLVLHRLRPCSPGLGWAKPLGRRFGGRQQGLNNLEALVRPATGQCLFADRPPRRRPRGGRDILDRCPHRIAFKAMWKKCLPRSSRGSNQGNVAAESSPPMGSSFKASSPPESFFFLPGFVVPP